MSLKRNTCLILLLLCALSLWAKSVSAGSSFLSPSQKPQGKGKPPRVGRRDIQTFAELVDGPLPQADKDITINAPFEIGITMSEREMKEYGSMLLKLLQDVLGDPAHAE